MQKQWSQSDIRFLLLIAQRSNSLDIKASNPLNIHEMSKNDWLEFPSTPKKWLSVSKEFPHCLKMTQNVSYFNSKIQTIFDNYARWNHHKSFELQAPLTFWVPERFKAWNQNIIIKYEPSDHNLIFKWFNFIVFLMWNVIKLRPIMWFSNTVVSVTNDALTKDLVFATSGSLMHYFDRNLST